MYSITKSVSSLFFECTGARLFEYYLTQTSRFSVPPIMFLSCPSAMLRLSVPSFVCCGCFITRVGVPERVYVQGLVDVILYESLSAFITWTVKNVSCISIGTRRTLHVAGQKDQIAYKTHLSVRRVDELQRVAVIFLVFAHESDESLWSIIFNVSSWFLPLGHKVVPGSNHRKPKEREHQQTWKKKENEKQAANRTTIWRVSWTYVR